MRKTSEFSLSFAAIVSSICFILCAVISGYAQDDRTLRPGKTGEYTEAKLVSVPKPEIPKEAAEVGIGGKVSVTVSIDDDGNVTSVDYVMGPDSVCPSVSTPAVLALRNVSRDAAIKAKFSPAIKEGKPAKSVMRLNFDFGKSLPTPGLARVVDKVTDGNFQPDSASLGKSDAEKPATNGPPKLVSGGVLNGKAEKLPKPSYPPAAIAVRAGGAVAIQVLIEIDGSVYSAQAVSGHPLLRSASRLAACDARFSPTLLLGQPVKVSGVITYNFVP